MANEPQDTLVATYIAARSAAAVQKARLATLRASYPRGLVYVFEGKDDKGVYFQWITRLGLPLSYEAFVSGNKEMSLQLFDALKRDRSGLDSQVYFFVDHDFDGLQGRADSPLVFVTNAYSIENYLVSSVVLEAVLKVNFHCDGLPALRTTLQAAFQQTYETFLAAIAPLNLRIFLARKCGIRQVRDLPTRLNEIAVVALDGAELVEKPLQHLVELDREPSPAETEAWNDAFLALDRRLNFRGKYCLLFFLRWLDMLLDDRKSKTPAYFTALNDDELKPRGGFTMDDFASKSELPDGLADFVQSTMN